MNRIFRKKLTYQGRVYDLPEYLELQLKIKHLQEPDEPLIPLGSRIKNGRLWIDDGWSEPRARFTLSEAPKFLGVFKNDAVYLLNIKIRANSSVIKYFLDHAYAAPKPIMKKLFSLEKESLELGFKDMEKYWQKCSEIEQLASQITQARRQHSWKKESIEYVVVREMICCLGKRHFDCDKEHFWHEIKKQLFKVIDEASD